MIKEKFASCTVLTVAHRIHTIIDADTVLCFDAGRLVGKGSPHSLLQDPGSVFFGLVEETGEASAAMLRQRAAEKCAGHSRGRRLALALVCTPCMSGMSLCCR